MGGCCGRHKDNTQQKSKKEPKKQKPSGQTVKNSNHKNKENENNSEEGSDRKLITDEKLKEESQNSFRGGVSAYGQQKAKHRKLKPKSQIGSKEFCLVKAFLERKGYEVVSSIGSGTYAEVYKAVQNQNKKTVAVKVIDLTKVKKNYRTTFLQDEIRVLQECKHPNVIKMYDISQAQNRIFMIMEFAPNGTLTDWLRDKGAMSEMSAHLIFTEIVSAVNHMHSRSIAHRDLKLENILLTENYNPKISDFSYAVKHKPYDSLNTSFCGSLPYFSPELLQRIPYNPLISDIWSLGVCFYIMLNDGLPFKLGNDRLMLSKQLSKDWSFKPKVESKLSEDIKSMVRKMLEPNVEQRITASQLMEDNWIKNY